MFSKINLLHACCDVWLNSEVNLGSAQGNGMSSISCTRVAGHDGFRYSYRLAVGVERKKEREKERKEKKRDRFYLFLNQNFFYLKFYLLWELWWLYGEVISITLEIRCQGQLLLLVHNNRKIFTTAKHLFRISFPISMTFSFPNWENFLNSVPKVLDPSYLLKKLLSKGVYT